MRRWWRDLGDLVLPTACTGCGGQRGVLCPECGDALSGAVPRRVRPVPEPAGLPVVHASAPYADAVRALLLAHKERGALALAGPLGTALAAAVRAGLREPPGRRSGRAAGGPAAQPGFPADGRPVLLVPVPSARRAVRARGHDPARRIALAAAAELRRTGTAARVLAVLRQRRPVADQSGLDARQRWDNVAGALAVAPGGERLLGAGGRVVLVDDLMTTGSSLAEAARAVRAAVAENGTGRERRAGGGPYRTATAAVYSGAMGEGREEQKSRATEVRAQRAPAGPGMAGANGAGDMTRGTIRAAVVAASPDAFEINRNS
ncbi:ComF family protein [Streptomyces poriticola]|uniref:ComF family protein n=1 Tax=Streptomyces poriticola TaxID=3120506 RepID=UPI002FCE4D9A